MADLTTTIESERMELARRAARTLGSIAGPLQFLTVDVADAEIHAAHQLAIRVEELAMVIMSALDDELADLDDARDRLLGPEMRRRLRTEAANG